MLHTSWYSCRPRRHCHNWEAGNKGNINTYTKATKTHNLEQFSNTSNTPQYPTYKEKVTQLGTNKNTVQGRSFQECKYMIILGNTRTVTKNTCHLATPTVWQGKPPLRSWKHTGKQHMLTFCTTDIFKLHCHYSIFLLLEL